MKNMRSITLNKTGEKMGGKPVLTRAAKTVLSLTAHAFKEKGLCDGITVNPGDACVFSCTYCYVGPGMAKLLTNPLKELQDVCAL